LLGFLSVRRVVTGESQRDLQKGSTNNLYIWKRNGNVQLHALASIFKRSLVSVYPKIEGDWLNEYGDGGLKRLDVYREIKPRVLVEAVCDGPNPTIMWTKMGSRGRTWRPNHFVACLPPSTSQSHSVSSGKRKADLREFFWKRTKTN